MRLEDELKQTKPFQSEFQKLVLNINVTSSWLNTAFSYRLKPFDITPHQYNVLRILKGRYPDGYCNQDIAGRMIDKNSNVTRIVDKLQEKKLADRTENPDDRRAVVIRITTSGLQLLEDIDNTPWQGEIDFEAIGEEKAKLMNEWLDALRSAGEKEE